MSDTGTTESHGVHGAPREDGKMQEEPSGDDVQANTGGEQTETGGEPT